MPFIAKLSVDMDVLPSKLQPDGGGETKSESPLEVTSDQPTPVWLAQNEKQIVVIGYCGDALEGGSLIMF